MYSIGIRDARQTWGSYAMENVLVSFLGILKMTTREKFKQEACKRFPINCRTNGILTCLVQNQESKKFQMNQAKRPLYLLGTVQLTWILEIVQD